MTSPRPESDRPLSDRLRDVQVGTRRDLDVSRHVFRNRVAYIVRDPVTFQTHSLTVPDYEIFIRIAETHPLHEVFSGLVRDGRLTADREEEFYEFVLRLHQLGFLTLPVSDAQALYKRHVRRQTLQRRSLVLNVLFLRIPLINPDAFLERTMRLARPVFSTGALVVWLALATLSLVLVVQRWDALTDPLAGVLVLRNLPLIWVALVALKIIHEFGHAYACKHFGGCVPEMGVFLILFTPCAYVDATDSWRFPSKRDRLIVCLGGMYVESVVAMLALFVWSMTEASFVNALAYQVLLLASITTVGFNANPLMRFDGYYILGDLLEIPNLRRRANEYLLSRAKRLVLGLTTRSTESGSRLKIMLAVYGISAVVYKVALMLGIGALIALRLPLVGLWIAGLFVGGFAVAIVFRTARYLLLARETAPVRWRATLVSSLLFVAVPAAVMLLPLPGDVVAAGVLEHEGRRALYAQADGFVRAVHAEPGDAIDAGEALVELDDSERLALVAQQAAEVDAAALRLQSARVEGEAVASQERERLEFQRRALAARQEELDRLLVRSGGDGVLVEGLRRRDVGRYVRRGELLAIVSAGAPVIRVFVNQEDLVATDALLDRSVECRSLAAPEQILVGRIMRVAPAGSRALEFESLSHLSGGEIAVDPLTGETEHPYFEIMIRLDDTVPPQRTGATYLVRLPAAERTMGDGLRRQLLRFYHRLKTGV